MFSILENYDIDYSKVGRLDISEFAYDDSTEELEEYASQLFNIFLKVALDHFVNDVFANLFWNKNFLYEFNIQCAQYIGKIKKISILKHSNKMVFCIERNMYPLG